MKCPRCKGDKVTMFVDLNLLIPSDLEGRLSKKNLRRKDVEVWGASWDHAAYQCNSQKCGWNFSMRQKHQEFLASQIKDIYSITCSDEPAEAMVKGIMEVLDRKNEVIVN